MKTKILEKLLEEKRVDELDIDIFRRVKESFLGLYVTKAFRFGFLRVKIGQNCEPSLKSLFLDEEELPPEEDVVKCIEHFIVEEFRTGAFDRECFKVDGEELLFPYAQAIEDSINKSIGALARTQADVFLDEENHKAVEREIEARKLHEEQKEAIKTLLSSSCGFLTGGPGTGKTFTAGMWLKALFLSSNELHIVLCAPTGRAAQNLGVSIQKNVGESAFDVQTIHKLLLSPFTFFPYNIIIVDECSMIDSALFAKFIERVRPGTRLLLLGDPDQLPPIDPGCPFRSLLAHLPVGARRASLSHSRRTESKEILEVANMFLQGAKVHEILTKGAVRRIDLSGAGGRKRLESLIEEYIIDYWAKISCPEEACEALRETIVLTPTRVGPLGTERINEFVRSRRKKGALSPVVFTKNDHELNVMNGDLGVLERNVPLDYVHSLGQKLPAAVCPRFEEAFAMSVHKSQGSEFRRVILVLPPGGECSAPLLYTAVTRAIKELIIVG